MHIFLSKEQTTLKNYKIPEFMGACDKYMKEMGLGQINMHPRGKPGNIRTFKKSWESSKILKNLYGCRICLVLFSCEIFSFIF